MRGVPDIPKSGGPNEIYPGGVEKMVVYKK
jgi:hypothetical protein